MELELKQSETEIFDKHCHKDNTIKPIIHQIDEHSFFNVTNSLSVTGIAFEGT